MTSFHLACQVNEMSQNLHIILSLHLFLQSTQLVLDKLLCFQGGECKADKGMRNQYALAYKQQAASKISDVQEEMSRGRAENPYIREIDAKQITKVLQRWMVSDDREAVYRNILEPLEQDEEVTKMTQLASYVFTLQRLNVSIS
jgi:hypothetical protein